MKLGAPSPLGAARGAFYAFLLGMALYTYRIAVDETASLRRELQQRQDDDGCLLGAAAAAHEALAARVARQDGVIAELREGSMTMGAALRESRKSAVDFAARLLAVETKLEQQKGEAQGGEGARRQMQGAEPERQGDYVLQIKRNVTRTQCGGPGSDASNGGHFDMSRCADHVFRRCHRKECIGYNGDHSSGKHRRAQAAAQRCKPADLAARTAEITAECCDEPDEDCTGGTPHNCNAGCAAAFLPFWGECRLALGEDSGRFEAAVALCEAAAPAAPSPATSLSLAEQLNVQCIDGTATEDCVPTCTADLHGFLMLLNIDGEDSKLSCELHHALYSWVGAATDGGYLGSDFQAFFSAVVSGAAGVYVGMLVEDAGISTDLVVTPGQSVAVTGQAAGALAAWGVGDFSVDERGSLALTAVLIQGAITVAAGASLTAQGSTFSDTLAVSGTMEAHDTSFSNTLTVSGTASLSGCTLAASATIDLGGGGSLSLASMAVPPAVLGAAERTLSGAGSTLRLDAVTVQEFPDLGGLRGMISGIMTVAADGSKATEPQSFGVAPFFVVLSGPCTVSEGGRCVGRPEGYLPLEDCAITVVVGGGVLGPCPVFDTYDSNDPLTLPGGAAHGGSDCPEGVALAPGDAIAWTSNDHSQGSVGFPNDNGCAAKGTCGLPYTYYGPGSTEVGGGCGANNDQRCPNGLGGGWELCF